MASASAATRVQRGILGPMSLRALLVTVGLLPWALLLAGPWSRAAFHAFSLGCHQRPERTLLWDGIAMVVCSRCAGIFAGVALGGLLPIPARLPSHGRTLVLLTVLLMSLDVLVQDVGLLPLSHGRRMGTGLLFGYVVSGLLSRELVLRKSVDQADYGT